MKVNNHSWHLENHIPWYTQYLRECRHTNLKIKHDLNNLWYRHQKHLLGNLISTLAYKHFTKQHQSLCRNQWAVLLCGREHRSNYLLQTWKWGNKKTRLERQQAWQLLTLAWGVTHEIQIICTTWLDHDGRRWIRCNVNSGKTLCAKLHTIPYTLSLPQSNLNIQTLLETCSARFCLFNIVKIRKLVSDTIGYSEAIRTSYDLIWTHSRITLRVQEHRQDHVCSMELQHTSSRAHEIVPAGWYENPKNAQFPWERTPSNSHRHNIRESKRPSVACDSSGLREWFDV